MIQETDRLSQWRRQRKRFETLRQLGPLDGRTVLDVTCGAGDFYLFLKDAGCRPLYTGVDKDLQALARCRARFGGDPSCGFESGEVMDYQPTSAFDFVVAAGLRSVDALPRIYSWCTIGVAVSFVSQRPFATAQRGRYVDPAATVRAALRLTPCLRLAHDYLPGDFTLFLYKRAAWSPEPSQGTYDR